MVCVSDVAAFFEEFAPQSLAEDWDNVGLLIGESDSAVSSIMTCLTLTQDVAEEAVQQNVDLVVSHHPLMFRPIQRLTSETPEGKTLLELISARVAVFSPHTSYDSAQAGINQQLAETLGLCRIRALRLPEVQGLSRSSGPANDGAPNGPHPPEQNAGPILGAGRFGDLSAAMSLREFLDHVKACLRLEHLQFVGDASQSIERVGIACGAAAEFLPDAVAAGCQVLLTGEARFHACLEARTQNMALVLPGHYATERPAMEHMAQILQQQFSNVTVWASQRERDPLQWD